MRAAPLSLPEDLRASWVPLAADLAAFLPVATLGLASERERESAAGQQRWSAQPCHTLLHWLLDMGWCFASGHHGAIFGGACFGVRELMHLRSKTYVQGRWALLSMTA